MGGCRCTYRNCTVRSDGSTHMFHYPVFDKLRCHQWLMNAQRLDFLNLKVSQLKNRVVCQHHFKEEHFMNYMKQKLTFEAVPMLDGPFCDSNQHDYTNTLQEVSKVYPISLDDIDPEPEPLTLTDKKANFSVKYGDFLTNCEVMDLEPTHHISENKKQIPAKNKSFEELFLHNNSDTQKSLPVTSNVFQSTENPTILSIEYENLQINSVSEEKKMSDDTVVVNSRLDDSKDKNRVSVPVKQNEKVKIISQLEISNPILLKGKMESVKPSLVIKMPNKKNILRSNLIDNYANKNTRNDNQLSIAENDSNRNTNNEKFSSNSNTNSNNVSKKLVSLNNTLENKGVLKQSKSEYYSIDLQNPQENVKKLINTPNEIFTNKTLLKSKIKQDRVEEIREKRKFNMKLRDIIESCLDKIDEEKCNDNATMKRDSKAKQDNKEQVGSFLSKEPELPSVQDYTMACLEARIKKLENVLVNKIEQNSQRIVDLKKTFMISDKKSECTQTLINEESHKRHLYKEISKYLSPDANSLIYEELFINKYTQKAPKCSPSPKKRRKR